jgi:hypothetical protein
MYVEGVGQKSGPCTATLIDLLCFTNWTVTVGIIKATWVSEDKLSLHSDEMSEYSVWNYSSVYKY